LEIYNFVIALMSELTAQLCSIGEGLTVAPLLSIPGDNPMKLYGRNLWIFGTNKSVCPWQTFED